MTGGSLDRRLLIGMGVVVAALIALGLFVVGGPGTARLERLDEERRADLQRIQRALRNADPLPASLSDASLRLNESDWTDPVAAEPYGYRVLSDSTYELCATFALSSDDLGRPVARIGRYDAGRHCFTVDTGEIP
ncbi:MAG: hypothetical protein AAGI52_13000 [Bacteroidota bacterium]